MLNKTRAFIAAIEQAVAERIKLSGSQSVAWKSLPERAKEGIKAGLADILAAKGLAKKRE